MKVIFLDIDGCLNAHKPHPNGYCGIDLYCMEVLNWAIRKTDAKIVLSSAWRYMVTGGACTLKGFEYWLRTYGFEGELVGHTVMDEVIPERSEQIKYFLSEWKGESISHYVVVDDLNILQHPFVKCQGDIGLTYEEGKKITRILNAEE